MLPVQELVELLDKDLLEQLRIGHVQVRPDAAELAPDATVPPQVRQERLPGVEPVQVPGQVGRQGHAREVGQVRAELVHVPGLQSQEL